MRPISVPFDPSPRRARRPDRSRAGSLGRIPMDRPDPGRGALPIGLSGRPRIPARPAGGAPGGRPGKCRAIGMGLIIQFCACGPSCRGAYCMAALAQPLPPAPLSRVPHGQSSRDHAPPRRSTAVDAAIRRDGGVGVVAWSRHAADARRPRRGKSPMTVPRTCNSRRALRLAAAAVLSGLLGAAGCEPAESGSVSVQTSPDGSVKQRFNPNPTPSSKASSRRPPSGR